MKNIISLFISLFLLLICINVFAQKDSTQLTRQTKQWFKKKEWLAGLQLQPHETINKTTFARQYNINKVYWDKAFAFLKEQDLQTLAAGRYPIDGDNVFAIVTENPTKNYDSTKWESHHNYIDLHGVISGEEKIGVCPVAKLTVTMLYDASKDLVNYSGEGKLYTALPGTFFLFFPADAHRPNITPGGNIADKKIVIKIRYAE
ncbi:MAG TPA: YhcH/YjgK/YiaL family protein [Panacibacter sp.]|nr:YhcH/YjgK/YiaL family protein [Panacibacter sp.]